MRESGRAGEQKSGSAGSAREAGIGGAADSETGSAREVGPADAAGALEMEETGFPGTVAAGAAVVLLGHGSRAPQARELLGWVAERLGTMINAPVLAASLQFNQPGLADCCRQLAAAGARRIVIAPYFLFDGNHMQRDIPGELAALEAELPAVEFILAAPLGADQRLVEVIASRIGAAGNGAGNGNPQSTGRRRLRQNSIEKQSFEIIDELLGITDDGDPEYQVLRRVIHATGDPSLAGSLLFSPGALAAAMTALATGTNIFCDVNMSAAGLKPTADRLGHQLHCWVAGRETAALARSEGITRSAAGIRRLAAARGLAGAIVVVGNAPTALFETLRLSANGAGRPALIVGVPVGFVGAAESKQALAESGLDYIALPGNRGGSNVAVAIVNALFRLSVEA